MILDNVLTVKKTCFYILIFLNESKMGLKNFVTVNINTYQYNILHRGYLKSVHTELEKQMEIFNFWLR